MKIRQRTSAWPARVRPGRASADASNRRGFVSPEGLYRREPGTRKGFSSPTPKGGLARAERDSVERQRYSELSHHAAVERFAAAPGPVHSAAESRAAASLPRLS